MFGQQKQNKAQDDGGALGDKVDEKDKKIRELENKVKELENNWKRALADYQNLQKQAAVDRDNYVKYGLQGILLKFLDVLDHLEEAEKHIKDEGLDLIIKFFKDVFKSEGVEEMDRIDKVFDPKLEECVERRNGEKDNTVIEILRKGYLLRDKILRPAKVVVEVKK